MIEQGLPEMPRVMGPATAPVCLALHDGAVNSKLPPRGEVLHGLPMILSFDVDCGELVPGHRFIARGLSGPSRMPVPGDWDGDSAEYERMLEFEEAGSYPAFSLEYELVPGVTAAEGAENFFRYLAGIDYRADVELPWYPTDGGAIAPFEGGEATHGSRGDWPLPPHATILTFTLSRTTQDGFSDQENPAGDLVVNLLRREAAWHPKTGESASRTE